MIDVANTLVDMELLVLSYDTIYDISTIGTGAPHTPESLIHIYCYMDNLISAVQGDPDRQHQVFDGTVRALKCPFQSLPGDLKDFVSVKKIPEGEV